MYVSLVKPVGLQGQELDQFLEKGWFRLGKNLFTTSFLTFQNELYNALWLRVPVTDFQPNKTQQQLLKRSARFRVETQALEVNDEMRALFLKYRSDLPFEPAKDLDHILMLEEGVVFDTYCVCIYDADQLIACGIFDKGEKSMEGIVSFFDPAYRKFSLGKVLVLHKLAFGKAQGIEWFYPGYVVPGYPRFDYKLDIDKERAEYYDITRDAWLNIHTLDWVTQPLNRMEVALENLALILQNFGFEEFTLKKYRFFDIGLDMTYSGYGLLSYPYLIHCFSNSAYEEVVIVYNTFSGFYELIICHKIFQITMPPDPAYYSEYLIRQDKVVFAEKNPLNFAFGLQNLLRRNPQADEIN